MTDKNEQQKEYNARLSLEVEPSTDTFDIITISAGAGNGWSFTPEVLLASLPLWDGVECFIDHCLTNRSVRDLAGLVSQPIWDPETQAIKARLSPLGPSASLIRDLADQLKATASPKTRIGFSADLNFVGQRGKVENIVRVNSVDLVFNPARGGQFVFSLYNSDFLEEKGEENMKNNVEKEEQASQDLQLNTHPAETTEKDLTAQYGLMKSLRQQMNQWTLELGLDRSRLPKPMQDVLRKQFTQREFTASELDDAIEDQRRVLSQLTANQTVISAGRVEGMLNEEDRIRLAVEDLFGVERETNKNARVPSLSGIRELYLMLTGDVDLHGGYYPERVQLATTADFTGLVKNALNKIVVKTWEQLGRAGYDWWKDISTVEHFNSLHSITGTLIGTVSDLPAISEGGEYTELVVGDSPETASFTKYGGYIPMTLELIDRDDAKKLGAYARNLASA